MFISIYTKKHVIYHAKFPTYHFLPFYPHKKYFFLLVLPLEMVSPRAAHHRQGPQYIIFGALDGWRLNNMSWAFAKNAAFAYFTILFIACGFILFPSEQFRIVISCKLSTVLWNLISVIQEKFLVFFNLLWEPDITRLGVRYGWRVVHPWNRLWPYQPIDLVLREHLWISMFLQLSLVLGFRILKITSISKRLFKLF